MSVFNDNQIFIFGGFVNGGRVNELYELNFVPNQTTLQWSKHKFQSTKDVPCPVPRASHSSIFHENKLYVFGGQDDENNKLNDLWYYDIDTKSWV